MNSLHLPLVCASAVLVALCVPLKSRAAPADLDLSFGTAGKVTTDFGSSYYDSARSAAQQNDGKIVAVGTSGTSAGGYSADFAVARYSADGSTDTSFNGTGRVTTDLGNPIDTANSVAIQSDGKIVAAGESGYSSGGGSNSSNFAVVRYNADASLDVSFNGTGKVTTGFGSSTFNRATCVALQSDGKIVVAGESDYHIAVARYNINGTLDTTFNGTGKVKTTISVQGDGANSLAIQSDGKIVVAGYSFADTSHFALVRYNINGSLDTSFNGTGKVTTDFHPGPGSYDAAATGLVIQGDGKIVAAGTASPRICCNDDFAVARYNTDGSLDTSFNGTGKVTTDAGSSSYDCATSMALHSDGRIVVAGYSEVNNVKDFAVVRYNADGSLDSSFNGTGKVVNDFSGTEDIARSVIVQNDGKIVVGGEAYGSGSHNFALVRYYGSVDLTTAPPVLLQPANGATALGAIGVAFSLPEPALAGSVKLSFNDGMSDRTLTLAATNESIGTHSFTFDPLRPHVSGAIASGSPLPAGIYAVTVSYRDALGNPAASSTPALNVTVHIDTDGDGIIDNYETGTGVYVSPTDTGTNPANRDSDGDGLNDGGEVNTHHSNPNITDTDGDGFPDGFEVTTGFNPVSAASTPDALSTLRPAREFRFNAANGSSYRIEGSTDTQNWTTLETNIPGNGGTVTRFYVEEELGLRYFLRVRKNP